MKSNKLRKSAQGQRCTMNVARVCNYNPETTVLAHINCEGGCMGGKTDDFSAAFMCYECHTWYDQHKGSEADELHYTRRAMYRTWCKWKEMGINPFE